MVLIPEDFSINPVFARRITTDWTAFMDVTREVKNIRDAVDEMTEVQPGESFLISPDMGAAVSFVMLQEQSILLSRMLRKSGLEKGDKVAFLLDNGLLTAQLFLGTMYGGFVSVPLNVRAGASQLAYMIDHCDARVVFVEDQYTTLLSEVLESTRREIRVIGVNIDGPLPDFETVTGDSELQSIAADDVALLMYSSGSTGKPKGAVHTHSSILAHGRNSIEAHQLSSADRSLLVLPLYHINAECVTLIPTLLSGGSVVVAHRFVVSKFWDWVDELQITWSALVPTIISELVDWNDPGGDPRPHSRESAFFGRLRRRCLHRCSVNFWTNSSSRSFRRWARRKAAMSFPIPCLQARTRLGRRGCHGDSRRASLTERAPMYRGANPARCSCAERH
jgi:acyl-CoA synthetase (AMP-forming)/AMP-acid ligase II